MAAFDPKAAVSWAAASLHYGSRDERPVEKRTLIGGAAMSVRDPKQTLISRVGRFHYRLMFAVLMIGAQRAISSFTSVASACWPRLALSGT